MRTLIAAKCPGITLNSMHGFPELRHLDLTGCEGIAAGTAVSVHSHTQHTLSIPCLCQPLKANPISPSRHTIGSACVRQ